MVQPHLVLQYPDLQTGRVRLLAFTQDSRVLHMFKGVVLEEARLTLMACDDDVLRIEYQEELNKLQRVLDAVIPSEDDDGA